MEKLKLENISKSFGKKIVLDDINLSVFDKEFFCITGRLGAGKTTLLRIIAGLETPSSGNVYLDGEVINYVDPKDRRISMFFENLALYPNKTGFENIAFPLRIKKLPEDEIKKRVYEISELLNIKYLLDRLPRTFSGGEAQRVALARALVRDAKIYLLDEPLSNIDALLRIQARAEFRRLQRYLGKTFIYTTHDPIEALAVGDRVCVMREGKVLQIDKPNLLYDKPKDRYVAAFVGNPPMNFITCVLCQEDGTLYLSHDKFRLDVTKFKEAISDLIDREVDVGIRPEYIEVSKGRIEKGIGTKVLSTEYLGDKLILYLGLNDLIIRAIGNPELTYSMDEEVWIRFSSEKIHILDKKTEKVLV
ncbi:MAG: ABC transporter ATP-binding protein [Nitrososphaerales archaeon]